MFQMRDISIASIVIMGDSIKLFQAARRFHEMAGIYPPQPHQNHSFTFKNLTILCGQCAAFFGVFGFFVFLAKSMAEFSISFYSSITVIFMINVFVVNIWKAPIIYKLMETAEKLTAKSK